MIVELKIQNVALITELTLAPKEGLSVLTGETGAGKSILLGALSLILGERASADLIRANCETAAVEGLFDITGQHAINQILEEHGLPASEENMLVLKRDFFRNGRGKCYINSSLTTLNVLQKIGKQMVDLHGQHAHQSLMHKDEQRLLLDNWANLQTIKEEVSRVYYELKKSKDAQAQLVLDDAERARRIDLLSFQVKEIDEADLRPGELNELIEERRKLTHAEQLVTTIQSCLERLHRQEDGAVRDGLALSADELARLADVDSSMGGLADNLRSAVALVEDVVEQLGDFIDTFEADPNQLEWVEARLDSIQKLQRKYGKSEQDIIDYRDKAADELKNLNFQDEKLEALAAEEQVIAEKLSELTRRLSQARSRSGQLLAEQMQVELKALGFNQAVFKVNVTPREDENGWVSWGDKLFKCSAHGVDDVEYLIAPNPGEEAKPVAKTASGGELSRIMLAIKVIASQASSVPTMIFDEVDAGIGGATAEAVGKRLKKLSKHKQVIVITHLSQIARFGEKHFQVKKEIEHGRTITRVITLQKEERLHEIARLLAGDNITETALKHAEELINQT